MPNPEDRATDLECALLVALLLAVLFLGVALVQLDFVTTAARACTATE